MAGLRSRVKKKHHSRPDVIVGKNGVSEGVIREIMNRLKREEIIKVKLLRSSLEAEELDRRSMARLIAERTGAKLVSIRGRTIILYKPKRPTLKKSGG